MKKPVGLSRTDRKHPEGLTSVPWQVGKNLAWVVTVADTLANSYLTLTSLTAAELAASRKEKKYVDTATAHIFVFLALETLGVTCTKILVFFKGTMS